MKKLLAIAPFSLGLLMTGWITELAAQDSSAPAPRATISNRLPRRDTDGKIDSNLGDKNSDRPHTQRLSADTIVVESATYGDLAGKDPARIRDVKAKVEQALRKGDGRFTVSAMAEGDDPCYGTVKTLKVNYRVDGRPATFTGTDPETADLLEQE